MDEKNRKKTTKYHFKLFIADEEPNSMSALKTLNNICENYFKKRDYTIEIIDVLKDYKKALENNILLAPTLIIITPQSQYKIVGSLEETRRFLDILGLNNNKTKKDE